jgi:hypothetical protein
LSCGWPDEWSRPTLPDSARLFFCGDRSRAAARVFRAALDAERNGAGPSLSELDRILVTGHAGVSLDLGSTVYGFHPDDTHLPSWQVFERLKKGETLPGVVRDDTAIFAALTGRGLPIRTFDVVLPDPQLRLFQMALDGERQISQHSYRFPDGEGDCNCVTWLERLGLPLLTGRMSEVAELSGFSTDPSRRFGRCV